MNTIYAVIADVPATYGEGTTSYNVSLHASLDGARQVLRTKVESAIAEDAKERTIGSWLTDDDSDVAGKLARFLADPSIMNIHWREYGAMEHVGYSIEALDVEA